GLQPGALLHSYGHRDQLWSPTVGNHQPDGTRICRWSPRPTSLLLPRCWPDATLANRPGPFLRATPVAEFDMRRGGGRELPIGSLEALGGRSQNPPASRSRRKGERDF